MFLVTGKEGGNTFLFFSEQTVEESEKDRHQGPRATSTSLRCMYVVSALTSDPPVARKNISSVDRSLAGVCARQIKYLPLCLAMGICPDEPRSFFLQQYRWCMGTSTLVLQGEFWRSDISRMHKLCFVNGMFYYVQTCLVGGVQKQLTQKQ